MSKLAIDYDIATAIDEMGPDAARYLVDTYYEIQTYRLAAAGQLRSLEDGAGSSTLRWVHASVEQIEVRIRKHLHEWADSVELGQRAMTVRGIGPVLAAGLLAHLTTAPPTVGHWWAFAGLDPTRTWEKGQKRPHNAKLKTLCWKIGESFVKVGGDGEESYRHWYLTRKAYEQERNLRGEYAEQAESRAGKVGKATTAHKHYSKGRLPPAHIHARARRWAVKLFLSHYHELAYELEHGESPPAPYAVSILNHGHKIERWW